MSARFSHPEGNNGLLHPLSNQDHLMDSDVEEEEDDDDDELDDLEDDEDNDEFSAPLPEPIVPPVNYNRGRRTSVSAESMTPTNGQIFNKTVVPKNPEQQARIEMSIANNFLFKNLDEDQYKDVINAMTEKSVVDGEMVIEQGGVGDFFYVVESGSFDCFISKNGGPSQKVTSYVAGGSFGELALMYNAPRAATIQATTDSVLWALDRITFRGILMENTSRKRRMYETFLEEVQLLVSLEPYERHKIADALESVYFDDGEVVVKQGDVGNSFFLIESGEAIVTKTDENGIEQEVNFLTKGAYFGELALLNDSPRAATVKAKGRLKCATLGKKAFTRLLGPVMEILNRNTENYARIMYNTERHD
ncbi:cyclic nucleotide-binding-like protein [Jimgerdemannia flammicorona]|uniref:cAMP-dependent protein kinase regulatory subunit n=1 Tax=Jimgerdemannia flammicorona TaxID=994334 RepID=A0A433A261_9FUNG|nr:cyclic nucleotide-binding-like protein [Jimgerdemannia flammicorona]